MCVMFVIIFFFSSRRRHTRCLSDWSSDVCSSDLGNHGDEWEGQIGLGNLIRALEPRDIKGRLVILPSANFPAAMEGRSEERRVGKECRCGWWPSYEKKKRNEQEEKQCTHREKRQQ